MQRLENVIQRYAWGSRTALSALRGVAPSPGPEAELWMGAHSVAPSRLVSDGRALGDVISHAPAENLGPASAARFGPRLPFLFKVLAAAEPLSLQAHPTEAQAEEGFAREEAAGVPLSAPNRNYKDRHHKPELLCALTPFWALSGFRDAAATSALVSALKSPRLSAACAPLANAAEGALRDVFLALVGSAPADAAALVAEVVDACKVHESGRGLFATECGWARRLSDLYPGDVGAVVSLLLHVVKLEPGEALFLPAGNLHAYLDGTGLELMASSDNVLRGGLTKKHVDVPELSRVLDFSARPVDVLRGELAAPFERVYATTAPEFELSIVTLDGDGTPPLPRRGPEILLVTRGEVLARGRTEAFATRGEALYVPWEEGPYTLTGRCEVARASVGRL